MVQPLQHSQHPLRLYNYEPETNTFLHEVVLGLQKPHKELPSKYFYDEMGSQLFDQICMLDEYYPTRTELAIMQAHAREMADVLGSGCLFIEYGSGSSTKTRILLAHLHDLTAYVPIDISREHLLHAATGLSEAYPDLEILPVCADYTTNFPIPSPTRAVMRRVAYYPGSTIGNFDPEPARLFLQQIAGHCGPGGGLLIGVDLKKDFATLHRAYNDQPGVTARFNLHLLERINGELAADFQLEQFGHYAFYNPNEGRIEMHLASLRSQAVQIGGMTIPFARGESIWTESSYKYTPEEFACLAASAGWTVEHVWLDPQEFFSIQYLAVR